MKKKGYTLIELVAVIAIITILLGSGFTIVKTIEHMKAEVQLEDIIYEVMDILTYAKAYCRKNYCIGEIVMDESEKEIIFQYVDKNDINKKIIGKREVVPHDIGISNNFASKLIKIDDDGFITGGGTITIRYKGSINQLTVAVGNDLITVIKDVKN